MDGQAFISLVLFYFIEARQAIFKILGMGWGEKCRKYEGGGGYVTSFKLTREVVRQHLFLNVAL